MDFRALKVAVLAVLLPITSFAQPVNCQYTLDSYLRESEQGAMYRFTSIADDLFPEPFLDRGSLMLRAADHNASARIHLTALMNKCFALAFDLHPGCKTSWQKVSEANDLVGASLSRLDVLNRDPVPKDVVWGQITMERQLNSARDSLWEFRRSRNELLKTVASTCLRPEMELPKVDDNYFMSESSNPTLDLLQERFKATKDMKISGINMLSLKCQVINGDGSPGNPVTGVGLGQTLEMQTYKFYHESKNVLVMHGQGSAKDEKYFFRNNGDEWVADLELTTTFTKKMRLRITDQNQVVIESNALPAATVVPIVYAYWSCK